jgi:hypothetical protein
VGAVQAELIKPMWTLEGAPIVQNVTGIVHGTHARAILHDADASIVQNVTGTVDHTPYTAHCTHSAECNSTGERCAQGGGGYDTGCILGAGGCTDIVNT